MGILETATDRDSTIKEIKRLLKKRSGKSWSVTGGQGTAWGWISINVLPKNRLAFGAMSEEAQEELCKLLGLDRVHHQGVSIPASSEYRREYLYRANGWTPEVLGSPYWD